MFDANATSRRATIWLTVTLIASFVIAYLPVWKKLVFAWSSSEEYSHGFFIIPICAYIIWRKRKLLARTSLEPSAWGLVLVLLSLFVYVFANLAEIVTLASLSMVSLIGGLILYLYGYLILKELLFPLFFLLFMIPVPAQIYSSVTVPLQLFVSKASVWIASHFGMPVYREGNVIYLPDHTMQVVQACSGLRSMISLLTLSAIFGYFTLRSNFLRMILFISGIPASIVVNVIRVLLLVAAFHYFNFDLTVGTVHTIFGISIFVLALILIVCIKGTLSNWDRQYITES